MIGVFFLACSAAMSPLGWPDFTLARSARVAGRDAGGSPVSAQVEALPLGNVRLSNTSRLWEAQRINTAYLVKLDPERLLYQFRTIAGLPTQGAVPYGGWESPEYVEGLINGHFTGHFLSALAFTVAGTDGPEAAALRDVSSHLVTDLAQCQAAIATTSPHLAGFVSAYPIEHIERMEAHNATQVWAPYYTLHKIMAGLLDSHRLLGNVEAFTVLKGLANFVHGRVSRLIAAKGPAWWTQCLEVEFGGMNEVAYSLYALTSDPADLELAHFFYKGVFMDPLARGQDSLSNNHANTHLPEVVGVARGWEVEKNATLHEIVTNFYAILSQNYSYATGGSNVNEHWQFGAQLGDAIATRVNLSTGIAGNSNGFHTEETCTVYNQLKVVRHLFEWAPSVPLADAYERMLLNGIVGVQNTDEIGSLSYMTPLGTAVARTEFDWWGFGSHNASFWCCYGTTIESFGKLADSLFFQTTAPNGTATLYIAQPLASASASWAERGVEVKVQAVEEYVAGASRVAVTIDIAATSGVRTLGTASKPWNVLLRVPSWSVKGRSTVGSAQVPPGTFVKIAAGVPARVHASFGMEARLVPLRDTRPAFASVAAIAFGPHVLAGLVGNGSATAMLQPSGFFGLDADPSRVSEWVTPTRRVSGVGLVEFKAVTVGGSVNLIRLSDTLKHVYTVYFNVSRSSQQPPSASVMGESGEGDAKCWPGRLEGGNIHNGSMTLASALQWCTNSTSCGGFSTNVSSSSECNASATDVAFYQFKDHWGAARLDPTQGWATWLVQPPPRPTYVCQGGQCVPGAGRVQYFDPHCLGLCSK